MKLFLIDGHALVFKMYYAFLGRPMINSKGVDTSILFGFTKYLLELISREKPTHVAVSFDPPGGTFRNELYPEYKANRGETPQLVIDALEPLTEIVKALGIPVLMLKGFEADDVIGSAAIRFRAEGFDSVYMVTPDKDYGQIVSDGIFQYRPGKSGADHEILGPAEVCAKWNIADTKQVIDILAICGDSSDNVPGVQGVGPVGAAKLLAKYGTMEAVYDNLGSLTERQRQLFEDARPHMALSKQLVTIKTDIPLDVTASDLQLTVALTPAVSELFNRFEFPSLFRLVREVAAMSAPAQVSLFDAPEPEPEAQPVCAASADINAAKAITVTAAPGKEYAPAAVALDLAPDGLLYVSDGTSKVLCGAPELFRGILEDPSVEKRGINIKELMNSLAASGIELRGHFADTTLMHYVVNPERSHNFEALVQTGLGIDLESQGSSEPASLFDDAPEGPDQAVRTAAIFHLAQLLDSQLTGDTRSIYNDIEEPLIGVLSRMERTGVRVDLPSLRDFADGLRSSMAASEQKVRELAGEPSLNVASPKQIGELLFEKLKLDPKARKPKSGSWPTDEQTLSALADRSPIIDAILDYRGTRKLLSTYIEPFPQYISPLDGRVHTSFNQSQTSTGRLSSSNPNLQNIPIRTEQGREIRKAFVPGAPDSVMMSADYSQIELRIMAHLCGDEHLCEAFRSGVDVHSATAAKIFGIPVTEVTPDQRRVAKTANFGIMYGISSFGLSQRLGCSRSEAKQIIEDYFASFPSIRQWIDGTLAKARETLYVETLFGRRRYVPDVVSHNATVRAAGERNAVNAPIQGTSADIIKIAMARVDRRLREGGFQARMVLQIHDELVLEVPRSEIEAVQALLTEEMQNVVKLNVPLTAECNYGSTWLEAH